MIKLNGLIRFDFEGDVIVANIYISRLNKELKRNILNRRYTVFELEKIKEKVNDELDLKKKGFMKAFLFLMVIYIGMMLFTGISLHFKEVFWFTMAVTTAMIFLILVICWFIGVEFLKLEYNLAIKKAYPEHADFASL